MAKKKRKKKRGKAKTPRDKRGRFKAKPKRDKYGRFARKAGTPLPPPRRDKRGRFRKGSVTPPGQEQALEEVGDLIGSGGIGALTEEERFLLRRDYLAALLREKKQSQLLEPQQIREIFSDLFTENPFFEADEEWSEFRLLLEADSGGE